MKKIIFATKDMLRNYFRINGRLSRAGYWWGVLGYVIISVICSLISMALDTEIPVSVCGLVFFIPLFTAALRRYHDCGWSTSRVILLYVLNFLFGWVTLGSLVSMILGFASDSMGLLGGSLLVLGICLIGNMVVTIIMFVGLFKRSEPGENRYGMPNPFDPDADSRTDVVDL